MREGEEEEEQRGRRVRLFPSSPLVFIIFFQPPHMAAEERGGKRQRKWRVRVEGEGGVGWWGDSSMTNFPFFYGGINLTGVGEWGGLRGRVEILLAR